MAAQEHVKRYFARAFDSDQLFSNSAQEHQPLRAIVALCLSYLLFQYTTNLFEHCIERILLRSFPAWAEKTCIIKEGKTTTWLHDHSGRPEWICFGFVLLRFWPWLEPEHLWILVRDYSTTLVLFQAAAVALLFALEQSLRVSHKIRTASGWVPYDEPLAHSEHTQSQGLISSSLFPPSPVASDNQFPQPTGSEKRRAWHKLDANMFTRQTPLREVRQRLFEMYGSSSPRRPPPRRCTAVEDSAAGVCYYQSITAEQEYQSMSFEELRLEHYQEEAARAQPNDGRSLLAKSISFLSNSFLGNNSTESMPSRDSFGRVTSGRGPLLVDGAASSANGGTSKIQTSDLLTGSPRDSPLEMRERSGLGGFPLAVSVENESSA